MITAIQSALTCLLLFLVGKPLPTGKNRKSVLRSLSSGNLAPSKWDVKFRNRQSSLGVQV